MSNSKQNSSNIDTLIKKYLEQQKRKNKIIFKLNFFFREFFNQYRAIKIEDIKRYLLVLIVSIILYVIFKEKAYSSNPDKIYQTIVFYSLLVMLVSIMFILFSVIYDLQRNILNKTESLDKINEVDRLANVFTLAPCNLLDLKLKEKDISRKIIDIEKVENENIIMIPVVILVIISFVSYIIGFSIQSILEQGDRVTGIPIFIIATAIFSLIIKSQSELVAYKKVLIALQKAQIMKES